MKINLIILLTFLVLLFNNKCFSQKIVEQLNYKYLSERITVTKYNNNVYQLKHNQTLYDINIVSNTNKVRSMFIGKCLKNCPKKVFISKIVFTKNNESINVMFSNGTIKHFKK